MENLYDLIILGAGPAGLSAGIYAGRAKLKTLILENGQIGGRAYTTREIVNYPGFINISGPELTEKMRLQAESFGISIKRETVKNIEYGLYKKIQTRKNTYYAKTIIIATGTSPKILNIKGEKEFTGRGVAYCATCDGEFFKNQDIVVLGSGDQAIEESIYLTKFVNSIKIIVIHDKGKLDCNNIAKDKAISNPKISFIFNSTISEIKGNSEVESIDILNLVTNEVTNIKTNGVFMFVGMQPNTELFINNINNNRGWILTNSLMETNIAGVYACGDVREKYLRQISTAISDGATAAICSERFLTELNDLEFAIKKYKTVQLCFYDSRIKKSVNEFNNIRKNLKNFIDIDISFFKGLQKQYNINIDENTLTKIVNVGGHNGINY